MTNKEEILGIAEQEHPQGASKQQARKQRVLTRGTPSVTQSIAEAVVIKNENVFFLSQPDGNVPLQGSHGFGLYYHDCRYLSGYAIKIAGADPNVLVSNANQGFRAVFELTNPDIEAQDGGQPIQMDEVGIKWERMIDAGKLSLFDLFTCHNYSREHIQFPVDLTFQADFKDVFAIRGLLDEQPGETLEPEWQDGVLEFAYRGKDKLDRSLTVHFSPQPEQVQGTQVRFKVDLKPRESKELLVTLVIKENERESDTKPKSRGHPSLGEIEKYFQRLSREWVEGHTSIQTDSLVLNSLLDRSLHDLRTLRTNIKNEEFFAAGVPWFVTLFGRDSLITALQMLALDPEIAAETLRLLASYQGKENNEWRDEQPGKILHELRAGELAHLGEIPHTPYYGSVDATPLFLILISLHSEWTGSLGLFKELRGNIDLALDWIDQYGDLDGDGYIEYASSSDRGLINQGWKDSGNAIVNQDGTLAKPPIALVEVQAYVYMAKMSLADLFERSGEKGRADRLRRQAEQLQEKFNREFWSDKLGTYYLALQADDRPAAVLSSNAGHALWAGIATQEKARRTVERLMKEDMFNGWGVRTLSSNSQGYNPTGYHLGTVWPHDNAILAAGFRRYGFDPQAQRIFRGIVNAAMDFKHYRLPELFAGFAQSDYTVPVRFPVACHPQAWAAGSVPYMLTSLLGLQPEALDGRLRIVRPVLPDFVDRIQLRNLQVGKAAVDLNFERTSKDHCAVDVVKVEGRINVVVSTGQEG